MVSRHNKTGMAGRFSKSPWPLIERLHARRFGPSRLQPRDAGALGATKPGDPQCGAALDELYHDVDDGRDSRYQCDTGPNRHAVELEDKVE